MDRILKNKGQHLSLLPDLYGYPFRAFLLSVQILQRIVKSIGEKCTYVCCPDTRRVLYFSLQCYFNISGSGQYIFSFSIASAISFPV